MNFALPACVDAALAEETEHDLSEAIGVCREAGELLELEAGQRSERAHPADARRGLPAASSSFPVVLGLAPGDARRDAAHGAPVEVTLLEVNATYRRARPAWSAASESVVQESVTSPRGTAPSAILELRRAMSWLLRSARCP
jgi:hypothetical protein